MQKKCLNPELWERNSGGQVTWPSLRCSERERIPKQAEPGEGKPALRSTGGSYAQHPAPEAGTELWLRAWAWCSGGAGMQGTKLCVTFRLPLGDRRWAVSDTKGEEGSNDARPNSPAVRALQQEFNLLSCLRSLKNLALLHRAWAGSIPGGGRYEFESHGDGGVIPASLPLGTHVEHSPLSHSGRQHGPAQSSPGFQGLTGGRCLCLGQYLVPALLGGRRNEDCRCYCMVMLAVTHFLGVSLTPARVQPTARGKTAATAPFTETPLALWILWCVDTKQPDYIRNLVSGSEHPQVSGTAKNLP